MLFIDFKTLSSIAQSVEHSAVNRSVVGSSPTWGVLIVMRHEVRVSRVLLGDRIKS